MGYSSPALRVHIPKYRRLTVMTGGSNITYPQGYYKYRIVVEPEAEMV